MRDLVEASSWLKCTVLRDTALYNFTGMFTRPKLIDPLQMARGMGPPPSRTDSSRVPPDHRAGGNRRRAPWPLRGTVTGGRGDLSGPTAAPGPPGLCRRP